MRRALIKLFNKPHFSPALSHKQVSRLCGTQQVGIKRSFIPFQLMSQAPLLANFPSSLARIGGWILSQAERGTAPKCSQ